MKNVILIVTLIILASCGGSGGGGSDSDGSLSHPSCSTVASEINTKWTETTTKNTFNLTGCSPSTTCRLCKNFFCNSIDDIDLFYADDGVFRVIHFNAGPTITGKWQVCEGELQLYDMSGNNADQFFTKE